MISEKEAARAEAWVAGGRPPGRHAAARRQVRDGAVLPPTILTDVTPKMRVMCEEIFAPVLSVIPFDSFDEAVEAVNSVPFGLAAGLFTSNLNRAIEGSGRLHVGVVHINEPSSSRVDLMPFGGVKDSGVGQSKAPATPCAR
jgi:acyl-CoA reductase-like NAD-dependent aldehyde dehydrogenase